MRLFSNLFKKYPDSQKKAKFEEFDESFNGDQKIINSSKSIWLTSRGNHQGEEGNLDDAINDFEEAIKINSKHSPAYLSLCVAHREKGMLDAALNDLENMPEKSSFSGSEIDNRFQINFHKGLIYLLKEAPQKSKEYFKEALKHSDKELKIGKESLASGVITPAEYQQKEEQIEMMKQTINGVEKEEEK